MSSNPPPPASGPPPAQPLAPGNFDRAWNDPPLFSYSTSSTAQPITANRNVLQRIFLKDPGVVYFALNPYKQPNFLTKFPTEPEVNLISPKYTALKDPYGNNIKNS